MPSSKLFASTHTNLDSTSEPSVRSGLLPIKICEQIIDAVAGPAWGDGIWVETNSTVDMDLGSCGLVCRSWLPRSRRLLYHHVVLDGTSRTSQFTSSLSGSPFLGNLVNELTLRSPVYLNNKDPDPNLNWVYKAASVLLPPYLKSLGLLRLFGLFPLHPTFPVRLSRFAIVKMLVLLELGPNISFRDMVQLINRFPKLQRLVIGSCYWGHPSYHFAKKQSTLSSLIVRQYTDRGKDVTRWFLSRRPTPPPLTELIWVTFGLPNFDQLENILPTPLEHALHACSPTLQRLVLHAAVLFHDLVWDLSEYNTFFFDMFTHPKLGFCPPRCTSQPPPPLCLI